MILPLQEGGGETWFYLFAGEWDEGRIRHFSKVSRKSESRFQNRNLLDPPPTAPPLDSDFHLNDDSCAKVPACRQESITPPSDLILSASPVSPLLARR